jgi:anaerobic dimethyl sulfoxide reductase subunit C (anchor subunit)/Tat-targeted selenate reductase subunit YnfH
MEHALSELMLAVFSSLAPVSAGAFIVLAFAFCAKEFEKEELRRIDILTVIPFLVLIGGCVAAFFHLESPTNALQVFRGIGRSPLSNEILTGAVFGTTTAVYWVVALTGKLPQTARKVWLGVVAVLALVFAVFVGAAYRIETIPSWNTIGAMLSPLGFCLFGGGVLGLFILQAAGSLSELYGTWFKTVSIILVLVGSVVSIASVVSQYLSVESLSVIMARETVVVSELQIWLATFAAGTVLVCALTIFSIFRKTPTGLLAFSAILALATVFLGRLLFYALMVPVGL